MRGDDAPFLQFLGNAYRAGLGQHGLGVMPVTEPASLAAVARQLMPHAGDGQRRALLAVEVFTRELDA